LKNLQVVVVERNRRADLAVGAETLLQNPQEAVRARPEQLPLQPDRESQPIRLIEVQVVVDPHHEDDHMGVVLFEELGELLDQKGCVLGGVACVDHAKPGAKSPLV
jgi:hypothetical protein